jgi:hypothetical protein
MVGLIFIPGVAAALAVYLAVAIVAAHRLTQPRRRQPLISPAEVGLAYEDIRLQARRPGLGAQ